MKYANDLIGADAVPWGEFEFVTSPKFDGNRGLCMDGKLFTSAMPKQPRNELLWDLMGPMRELSHAEKVVFDYEVFDPDQDHHADLSGAINSFRNPLPETLGIFVFDAMPVSDFRAQCIALPFKDRIRIYRGLVARLGPPFFAVRQRVCVDATALRRQYAADLEAGFEGTMIRARTMDAAGGNVKKARGGWYKHGRATVNQAIGYKFKEYVTTDGFILEVKQRLKMKEGLERERDSHGHLKPPSGKDSYEPDDCAGALLVQVDDDGPWHGTITEIGFGRGFPMDARRKMWKDRRNLVGKHVEFTHMPHGAKKDSRLRIGKLSRFRQDKD